MTTEEFENIKSHLMWFLPYMSLQHPSVKIRAMFYTTNRCNLGCDICYRNSGVDAPQICLPSADYKKIVNYYVADPRHMGDVCLSGGEVTEIYKFDRSVGEAHYLHTLIQHAFDCGLDVLLKTNGIWADQQNSDKIWADLTSLDFHGQMLSFNCTISSYHKRAISAISRIIQRIHTVKPFVNHARIGLGVFDGDHSDLQELVSCQNLAQYGLQITSHQPLSEKSRKISINNKDVTFDPDCRFARAGRAEKNNLGIQLPKNDIETYCFDKHHTGEPIFENLFAFDENGYVALGNMHNSKIKTRYAKSDGSIKNFQELNAEFSDIMFNKCVQASEINYLSRQFIDHFLSLTPELLKLRYQEYCHAWQK